MLEHGRSRAVFRRAVRPEEVNQRYSIGALRNHDPSDRAVETDITQSEFVDHFMYSIIYGFVSASRRRVDWLIPVVVAGPDHGIGWKCFHKVLKRLNQLLERSSRQVCARPTAPTNRVSPVNRFPSIKMQYLPAYAREYE